jgi:tetratricopeptide (TPR) repeat protein
MSLLMQALKKAEQSKQKQQSDTALSLSPTENHVEPSLAATVADTSGSELLAQEPSAHSLSLDNTETSQASADAVLDLGLGLSKEHGSNSLHRQHEPTLNANADYDMTGLTAAPAVHSKEPAPETPVSRPEPSMAERLQRPRIDPEQVKAVTQNNPLLMAEQQKAKSVFTAKAAPTDYKKKWYIGLGSVSFLMLLGVTYLYWQNSLLANRSGLLGQAANNLPAPAPMPAPASVPNVEPNIAASAASTGDATMASAASLASTSSASTLAAEASSKQSPSKALDKTISANEKSLDLSRQSNEAQKNSSNSASNLSSHKVNDGNAIQIRKGNSGNQINPALNTAYQAFLSGDVASAEKHYQSVLAQEPKNHDALLGLAALALNQRNADKAGGYYGQLLELDPNDPDAIAGLTSLQQGDPAQSESRLKKALSLHPNAAAILFALGNLYAQQARWSDAQQFYFRAYATQATNADYAFNLAVSLDRLNQSKLAIDYYQRALEAGQTGPGNFSRGKVQQRIAELEKARDD